MSIYTTAKPLSIPLPIPFIENYMPRANANFVKVYLYGLKACMLQDSQMTHATTAQALDMLESDVIQAWKYWQQENVVKLTPQASGQPSDFGVEFLDLNEPIQPQKPQTVLPTQPSYTAVEIAQSVEAEPLLKDLFQSVEKLLGKPLSSTDYRTLFSLYDWARLPVEVILLLVHYCVSLDKPRMSYIEKVGLQWAEDDLNTVQKVELFLEEKEAQRKLMAEKNKAYLQVQKIFGIDGRSLSPKEKEYIEGWLEVQKFTVEDVEKAFHTTVDAIGKLSFPYLNKVLTASKDYKKEAVAKTSYKKPAKTSYAKGSKTNTHQYNFEEIQKKALDDLFE